MKKQCCTRATHLQELISSGRKGRRHFFSLMWLLESQNGLLTALQSKGVVHSWLKTKMTNQTCLWCREKKQKLQVWVSLSAISKPGTPLPALQTSVRLTTELDRTWNSADVSTRANVSDEVLVSVSATSHGIHSTSEAGPVVQLLYIELSVLRVLRDPSCF